MEWPPLLQLLSFIEKKTNSLKKIDYQANKLNPIQIIEGKLDLFNFHI